eukprot:3673902-Prymnesium_polylepis.1
MEPSSPVVDSGARSQPDGFVGIAHDCANHARLSGKTRRGDCALQDHRGGSLLNLLKADRGVYLVSLLVTLDNTANKHCVMLSTLKEPRAPHGKLIDDHGRMRPVYLEQRDIRG